MDASRYTGLLLAWSYSRPPTATLVAERFEPDRSHGDKTRPE
jgi:hypothetical protein